MTPLMQTVYRPAKRITKTMLLAIFLAGFACGLIASLWITAYHHQHRIDMERKLTTPVYAQPQFSPWRIPSIRTAGKI